MLRQLRTLIKTSNKSVARRKKKHALKMGKGLKLISFKEMQIMTMRNAQNHYYFDAHNNHSE